MCLLIWLVSHPETDSNPILIHIVTSMERNVTSNNKQGAYFGNGIYSNDLESDINSTSKIIIKWNQHLSKSSSILTFINIEMIAVLFY